MPADDLLEETAELAANIRDQLGGWVLPPGQSAVVRAPSGHLSIVHTSALEGWATEVERLRAALEAAEQGRAEAATRLAAVAQEALDEWADSLPYVDSYFAEKYGYAETMARLRATLTTLTGGARATLPPMATLPTLSQFAAVSYAATRPAGSPIWERLDAPTQERIAGRVLYGLDYLAGGEGLAKGVIYEASPTDPLPVVPEP